MGETHAVADKEENVFCLVVAAARREEDCQQDNKRRFENLFHRIYSVYNNKKKGDAVATLLPFSVDY
jgi:hypothetical protein